MEDNDYPQPEDDWDIDSSMEEQIKIQNKIEAFNQIDEDIQNGLKPF